MTAPSVVGRIAPNAAEPEPAQSPAQEPAQSPPASPPTAATGRTAVADRPTRILPTDRVGFNKQLALLRAFAVLVSQGRAAASNADVADLVKIHPNTSGLAIPFFVETGMLQKAAGGYVPAPEVLSYGRAQNWNAETAPQKLAPLLRRTWFGQALLPRLAMGPLDTREGIQVLAEACNAGPKYTGQLDTVLDYMAVAGLIRRDGDTLRDGGLAPDAPADGQRSADLPAGADGGGAPPREPPREPPRGPMVNTAFTQGAEGIVHFHVEVKVDMKEFANWRADRIAAFFGGIAQVLAAKAAVETEAGR